MSRILVIDDEPQIRRALRVCLEKEKHHVVVADDGESGLEIAPSFCPDAVILDLVMPGLTGLEVCRQLRVWTNAPIVVLSVNDREEDIVRLLDTGADDYVIKPFKIKEVLARLRAILRRWNVEDLCSSVTFKCDALQIDFAHRRVLVSGRNVHLTPKEYDLLCYLSLHPDRVITHNQLMSKVWGQDYEQETHTLRVHMANLRNKIEPKPAQPRFIRTEARIGYRFHTGTL